MYKLLFAGITVALALGNWAVIAWLQSQQQQTDSRIADSQSLLGRTREVHAHYRHWQAQTKLARQTVENLAAKMPASPQESQFLHELSQMAATNQVTLSDFRRGNIADLKEFKEIELRVRGTGTYAGLCRWLTGLEGLPRNVRVSQMTLSAPATAGGNCSVELDLHLRYGLSRTPAGTKRHFRLLTHNLKSSSCVALLDVVEESSIGQNATTTSRSASAETDDVRPTNTAWNRGWCCGLVTTSDSKQCHTFKKNATSQA